MAEEPVNQDIAQQPPADQDVTDHSAADPTQILLQASAAAEVLQQRFVELQTRRNELLTERQQLESERSAFDRHAREFAANVANDRNAHRDLQAELDQRLAAVESREQAAKRQSEEFRAAQRTAAEERVLQRQSLQSELEADRATIAQREEELTANRQQLEQRQRDMEESHSATLQRLEEEVAAEKESLEQRVRREMTGELAEVAREKQEWHLRRDEISQEIQQQQDDLHQQREQFGEHIEAERARLRDELEKRRLALQTEQNNLQRRYRFQFEHLTRARDDLELELREFRHEQQLFRTGRLKMLELNRLRFQQLDKIHSRLQQRDASLARELRVIERSRAASESQIQRHQSQFREQSEAATRDLETRSRTVRQQEASARELSTRLEGRSQRLNQMRSELDRSQAEILEQRLVLEEVRAKLKSDPEHENRIQSVLDQARADVNRFFEKLRQSVTQERTRLETISAEFQERQQQLRRDRSELESCFSQQDTESDSTTVTDTRQLHDSMQQQLATLQEEWKKERLDAERTIRDLLDQLTARDTKLFQEAQHTSGSASPAEKALPDRTAA
jgi:hypothetical protein